MNGDIVICTGSSMNGLDNFDIIQWCGLKDLSDSQKGILYGESQFDLLRECKSIDYYTEEGEEIVGFTDVYYTFTARSMEHEEKIKAELKEILLQLIEDQ